MGGGVRKHRSGGTGGRGENFKEREVYSKNFERKKEEKSKVTNKEKKKENGGGKGNKTKGGRRGGDGKAS